LLVTNSEQNFIMGEPKSCFGVIIPILQSQSQTDIGS